MSLALYHNRQIFIRGKYNILLQLTKVRIIFALSLVLSDAYCSAKLFRRRRFRVYPVVMGRILTLIFFFFSVCVCVRRLFHPPAKLDERFYVYTYTTRIYIGFHIFFLFYFYDRISSTHAKSQGCSSQRNGSEMWLRSNPGARSLRIRQWFNAPQGPRTPRHQSTRCCYGLCDLKTWQTSAATTSGIQQALVLTETSCIYDPRVVAPPHSIYFILEHTHTPTHITYKRMHVIIRAPKGFRLTNRPGPAAVTFIHVLV